MYQTYNNFLQSIETNPNKSILISILAKRAVHGISVISSFNELTCDFSYGLDTNEKECVEEFLNLFFPIENNLLSEITMKNVDPIVESIKTNYIEFEKIGLIESNDIIEILCIIEKINTKHYNLFQCLQYCLILGKLEQMECVLKNKYGTTRLKPSFSPKNQGSLEFNGSNIQIKSNQLNAKSVSKFYDLYNFMVNIVRENYLTYMKLAPDNAWTRMQLNSHKEIWALMWSVYASEFKFLYDIELAYQIKESMVKEVFEKLCGYRVEIDINGQMAEKFDDSKNTEKFNKFMEITQIAKDMFWDEINKKNICMLIREDYLNISNNVINQVVSKLDESDKTYAIKYLANILEDEINMELLLNSTTNTIDMFIAQLEKMIDIKPKNI